MRHLSGGASGNYSTTRDHPRQSRDHDGQSRDRDGQSRDHNGQLRDISVWNQYGSFQN